LFEMLDLVFVSFMNAELGCEMYETIRKFKQTISHRLSNDTTVSICSQSLLYVTIYSLKLRWRRVCLG